jgi:hypothetical protein
LLYSGVSMPDRLQRVEIDAGAYYALYALSPSSPPFLPNLSTQPRDFTIALSFAVGGLNRPVAIAIDGSGNAWIANRNNNSIVKLSSAGTILSGTNGYTGGLNLPITVAIDPFGNAWTLNPSTNSVIEFSASGSVLFGTNGYTGGGLIVPSALAIDGNGNAWVTDSLRVVEFSNTGSILSGPGGYGTGSTMAAIFTMAIDASGDLWVPNIQVNGRGILTVFSNSGTVLANGYSGGALGDGAAIAFDHSGNAWIVNVSICSPTPCTIAGETLVEFSSSGTSQLGANGLLWPTMPDPSRIAIDGGGNVWITNYGSSALNYSDGVVLEFSNAASILSPFNGYTAGGTLSGPGGMAIDGSGDVWISNSLGNNITEIIGSAVPVVTPLSVGVKTNSLGARP